MTVKERKEWIKPYVDMVRGDDITNDTQMAEYLGGLEAMCALDDWLEMFPEAKIETLKITIRTMQKMYAHLIEGHLSPADLENELLSR